MNWLQIAQLIISEAPAALQLTKSIEDAVAAAPPQHQQAVLDAHINTVGAPKKESVLGRLFHKK